mmetsp:Transcript_17239/g.56413  ORF Transcript_17239/g.56413 Transcript_17239/m.56413 type:complete len:125 (-) Transcript_17239:573-947(-)
MSDGDACQLSTVCGSPAFTESAALDEAGVLVEGSDPGEAARRVALDADASGVAGASLFERRRADEDVAPPSLEDEDEAGPPAAPCAAAPAPFRNVARSSLNRDGGCCPRPLVAPLLPGLCCCAT